MYSISPPLAALMDTKARVGQDSELNKATT